MFFNKPFTISPKRGLIASVVGCIAFTIAKYALTRMQPVALGIFNGLIVASLALAGYFLFAMRSPSVRQATSGSLPDEQNRLLAAKAGALTVWASQLALACYAIYSALTGKLPLFSALPILALAQLALYAILFAVLRARK